MNIQHSSCCTSVSRLSAGSARLCCSSVWPLQESGRPRMERKTASSHKTGKVFWRSGRSLKWACSFEQTCSSVSQLSTSETRHWSHKAVNGRPAGRTSSLSVLFTAAFFCFSDSITHTDWIKQKVGQTTKKSTSDSGKWGLACARCSGFCLLASAC